MQKLNFWVSLQEPKWHTPIRPLIHLPPFSLTLLENITLFRISLTVVKKVFSGSIMIIAEIGCV